jgi:peptide deformylase
VTWRSDETFTMWDDCMSFPGLLVRVSRASSISIDYVDEKGTPKRWERLDRAASELLQHEIDHLDGILAVDRAEGLDALVLREAYEANRAHHDARVDYTISPTITPR